MSAPIYPIKVTLCAAGPSGASVAGGASAFTDNSGTVTSGGTAQTIASANADRTYLIIQNHSDIDMWINVGVTAVADQPSIKLFANGGSYEPLQVPSALISLIGATTGKSFTCKEA
tara:strand:- start:333 stop:680 length:348 start_codon:yes stop_codon:yes gene_type:complete